MRGFTLAPPVLLQGAVPLVSGISPLRFPPGFVLPIFLPLGSPTHGCCFVKRGVTREFLHGLLENF